MNSNQLELVDVIDAEDHVLIQISKSEAHQQGLLHRTVVGELIKVRQYSTGRFWVELKTTYSFSTKSIQIKHQL